MKTEFKTYKVSNFSPLSDIHTSVRSSRHDIRDQHLLVYTPVARVNMYQDLIYKSFPDFAFTPAPLLNPSALLDLASIPFGFASKTLHLHWNSWMTGNNGDRQKSRTVGLGMVGRMERLKKNGFKILWTVHNVYPHDAQFVDVELEIQQKISEVADFIHVMSPAALDAMQEFTPLDRDKVIISPHPSYKGAYPDYVSRQEARTRLGIGGDETVLVMFGAIKDYKGLKRTQEMFEALTKQEPSRKFRLLVAGKSDGSREAEQFVRWAMVHPFVLVTDTTVPLDKVQIFLRAADIGLVNYKRSLNSGAALLYGSFDLPIVASNTPTFRSELDPTTTSFVKDDSTEGYLNAVRRSCDLLSTREFTRDIQKHQMSLDSAIVSSKFAASLLARIDNSHSSSKA